MLCGSAHAASTTSDDPAISWWFRGSLYAYGPAVRGTLSFPSATTISVGAEDILRHTSGAFMGAFEVRRGRFGAFVDGIASNLSASRSGLTRLSLGNGLDFPPSVNANVSLHAQLRALTLAGEYLAVDTTAVGVQVFAGARLFDMPAQFAYAFNTDFGPFRGAARQGGRATALRNWDGVLGAKTQFPLRRNWQGIGYADIGTGDSALTLQALAGFGRSARRVGLFAGWRHVSYRFRDSAKIDTLDFDGPFLGATRVW